MVCSYYWQYRYCINALRRYSRYRSRRLQSIPRNLVMVCAQFNCPTVIITLLFIACAAQLYFGRPATAGSAAQRPVVGYLDTQSQPHAVRHQGCAVRLPVPMLHRSQARFICPTCQTWSRASLSSYRTINFNRNRDANCVVLDIEGTQMAFPRSMTSATTAPCYLKKVCDHCSTLQ